MARLTGIKRQKLKYILVLLGLLLGPLLMIGNVFLLTQIGSWHTEFPSAGTYYCEELDCLLDCNGAPSMQFSDGTEVFFGTLHNSNEMHLVENMQTGNVVVAKGSFFWRQWQDRLQMRFDEPCGNIQKGVKYVFTPVPIGQSQMG